MKKQEKQLKELYFKGSLYALAVDDFIHETVGERTAGIYGFGERSAKIVAGRL